MTNRELLRRISEELESDGALDEEAGALDLLDMGGIIGDQGCSDAYIATIQSRVMASEFGADWFRVVRTKLGTLPAWILDDA